MLLILHCPTDSISLTGLSYGRIVSHRHASLTGVHLIYESSLRAGHGRRGSLYRHQGCLKLLDCGRLGRKAAGQSPLERAPRGEKLPKRLPNGLSAAEAKAAALHPQRYQSFYLNYLQRRWARRGKEAQVIGLASQSDRQKSDCE
jgi:hypothetical protein